MKRSAAFSSMKISQEIRKGSTGGGGVGVALFNSTSIPSQTRSFLPFSI